MKEKKFDAVQYMRQARKRLARKLSGLSGKEQLELLRRKYGHLMGYPKYHLASNMVIRDKP